MGPMNTKTFFLYLATWTLVALSPGPAVLFSMAASMRSGFRQSLLGILGIQAGNSLFFFCSAFGLGALLSSATQAFAILRCAGALYLLYLGSRIIISTFLHSARPMTQLSNASVKGRNVFFHGLLVQVTNPKALLFVSALLPQFIDPRGPAAPQLGVLGVATIVVDAAVLTSYAFFASRGIQTIRGSRAAAWLERVCGAALIAFGVRLMRTRR
jgi:homoserine/homoserine lactone efflux protein